MSGYESKFHELLEQAEGLKESATQIMLVEEAIRLSDSHGDRDLSFMARETLVEIATFGGYPEKALIAFSWCLAQSDKDPDYFPELSLLWQYKWVVLSLAYFPQLTRQQINVMMEDITNRYRRLNISLRPIYNIRCRLSWAFGDHDAALSYRQLWQKAPRDEFTNCYACELDDNVEFLLNEGKDEEAISEAAAILQGRFACAEVPHHTYARLLFPLLRTGQLEDAVTYHLKGYEMIARNRDFLNCTAEHLLFATLTDNLPHATELFSRHLSWALDTKDMFDRLQFYTAARFLLHRLQHNGQEEIDLRLPPNFPAQRKNDLYPTSFLQAWFDTQAREIVYAFNRRNGNSYFSDAFEESKQWDRWIQPTPLSHTNT